MNRERLATIFLATVAIGQASYQFLMVRAGLSNLFFDAREVWYPVAEAVSSGEALYLGNAGDNKPPLFEILNVLFYQTGQYELSFFAFVGLSNALAAVLLYRWVAQDYSLIFGEAAALLYLSTLPLINGTILNVRSVAVVCLLFALYTEKPFAKGVSIATGAMFSQYTALAAIPILLWGIHRSKRTREWVFSYISAGLLVIAVSYGTVGVIWGVESFQQAILSSVLAAGDYVATPVRNPLINPIRWVSLLGLVIVSTVHVCVPAAILISRKVRSQPIQIIASSPNSVLGQSLILSVLYFCTLFIKSLRYYWVFVMPFFSVLTAELILLRLHSNSEDL
ncbi:hypothetical protein ACFQFH_20140 [Halobaculum halobium]|uniref:hypothetical protein n=1 Tax=Halobaculum halobium TaxID=3032281 RepID=UPI00360C49DB